MSVFMLLEPTRCELSALCQSSWVLLIFGHDPIDLEEQIVNSLLGLGSLWVAFVLCDRKKGFSFRQWEALLH